MLVVVDKDPRKGPVNSSFGFAIRIREDYTATR